MENNFEIILHQTYFRQTVPAALPETHDSNSLDVIVCITQHNFDQVLIAAVIFKKLSRLRISYYKLDEISNSKTMFRYTRI